MQYLVVANGLQNIQQMMQSRSMMPAGRGCRDSAFFRAESHCKHVSKRARLFAHPATYLPTLQILDLLHLNIEDG